MPSRRSRRIIFAAVLSAVAPIAGGPAAAQDAAHFSPTYAASKGSPYSEIYARTFGAPPLETAAPATGPAAGSDDAPAAVVYVIEDGRLITYSAGDYARGGEALAETALPAAPAGGRLYGAVPPPEADGSPIPLLQPNPAR